jgi:6-pyruvoyltetrahydropterin/6-carboxytetrahydropterin synthase
MSETFCEFSFEAAHRTPPYSGLHGHSFTVRVSLKGAPDPVFGWSHNLHEVEPVLDEIRAELDHRFLNEIEGLEVPTLENVARWVWHRASRRLQGLDHVIVSRGMDGRREGSVYRGPA